MRVWAVKPTLRFWEFGAYHGDIDENPSGCYGFVWWYSWANYIGPRMVLRIWVKGKDIVSWIIPLWWPR